MPKYFRRFGKIMCKQIVQNAGAYKNPAVCGYGGRNILEDYLISPIYIASPKEKNLYLS